MEALTAAGLYAAGWMGVGAAAHAADARWGVGFRGWWVSLCSREAQVTTAGFLKNRSLTIKLAWSVAIASAIAGGSFLLGAGAVHAAAGVVPDALACFLGAALAPALAAAWARASHALDRVDAAEAGVRTGLPAARARCAAAAFAVAQVVRERASAARGWIATRSVPAPPAISFEQQRQAKIDHMERILGRR